jgi:hypothetical protein
MAFEMLPISSNMYSICGDISVLQLKVELTGQVAFTCPVPRFHQIRHMTRSRYIALRNGHSFSGQVKMKQAEIWFHMKKVPIYEDICTRLLYFDRVC